MAVAKKGGWWSAGERGKVRGWELGRRSGGIEAGSVRFVGELVPLGDRKGRRCSLSFSLSLSLSPSVHRSLAAGSNVSNEERISPPCASLEVRVFFLSLFSLSLFLSLPSSLSLSFPVWILWSSFAMWRVLARIIHDRLSISYMIFEIEYVSFILLFLTLSFVYFPPCHERVFEVCFFRGRRMKRKEIYTKNKLARHRSRSWEKGVTWLGFDRSTMKERCKDWYIRQGEPEREKVFKGNQLAKWRGRPSFTRSWNYNRGSATAITVSNWRKLNSVEIDRVDGEIRCPFNPSFSNRKNDWFVVSYDAYKCYIQLY